MDVTTLEAHDAGAAPLSVSGVGLAVRDIGSVERFYREAIGLEALSRTRDRVRLGAGGIALLTLTSRPDALPDAAAAAGLFHTAFLLPDRADLGRWLAHAAASHVQLDGAADHLVSEAVYLHDPEGNGIEIYADRPRAAWRWTGEGSDRRITMANSRLDTEGLLALATDSSWAGAPPGTRIGHVHLRVGDVDLATRFYGDLVGMDVTARWDSAVFLSTGGYHHHVACNTWQSAAAGIRDPNRAGLEFVEFASSRHPTLLGILEGREPSGTGGRSLRDPWGNRLHFVTDSHDQETDR